MCGIVGFIGGGGSAEHRGATAGRMADAIARRGPDDSGIWVDADAGLSFGHRRLSIVDLSPAGHQPMVSSCGRWVITFNGEIYNHAELRAELDGAGMAPEWRGHCDTEVLLAAIAAWGIRQALQRCVGMFAFGLWDKRERTLTLARDRLGEKPLYFGWAGKTFLFASELAALQKHPDWQGQIDRDALCLFLRFNYIPAPHTIYRGIRKLLPGTYFELRAGDRTGTAQIYWDSSEVAARGAREPFQGSPDEAVE
ncbi:MAG TPA: asparagine synthetase B, partial [Hyphomicrobium sp.]